MESSLPSAIFSRRKSTTRPRLWLSLSPELGTAADLTCVSNGPSESVNMLKVCSDICAILSQICPRPSHRFSTCAFAHYWPGELGIPAPDGYGGDGPQDTRIFSFHS